MTPMHATCVCGHARSSHGGGRSGRDSYTRGCLHARGTGPLPGNYARFCRCGRFVDRAAGVGALWVWARLNYRIVSPWKIPGSNVTIWAATRPSDEQFRPVSYLGAA